MSVESLSPDPPPDQRAPWYSSETARYALALLGYIVLGIVTKKFLTFTWGLMYFLLVLEVMPRTYRRAKQLLTHDEDAS